MLGVIGGSGVYQLDGLANARWARVASPFGDPSDEVLLGELAGQPMAFLPRHGRGHRIPPSAITYRANVDAMKRVGVTDLLSLNFEGAWNAAVAGYLSPSGLPGLALNLLGLPYQEKPHDRIRRIGADQERGSSRRYTAHGQYLRFKPPP